MVEGFYARVFERLADVNISQAFNWRVAGVKVSPLHYYRAWLLGQFTANFCSVVLGKCGLVEGFSGSWFAVDYDGFHFDGPPIVVR